MSPRAHELLATDRVELSNVLEFAGARTPTVEIIDVHRHAAEKFHAMLRDHCDRENSRVRDLVDLALLIGHDLLTPAGVASAVRQVWAERGATEPPAVLPVLPESWARRYAELVTDQQLVVPAYPVALVRVSRLWQDAWGSTRVPAVLAPPEPHER